MLCRKEVKVILRDQKGKEEKTADTLPFPSRLLVQNAMISRLFFQRLGNTVAKSTHRPLPAAAFRGRKSAGTMALAGVQQPGDRAG